MNKFRASVPLGILQEIYHKSRPNLEMRIESVLSDREMWLRVARNRCDKIVLQNLTSNELSKIDFPNLHSRMPRGFNLVIESSEYNVNGYSTGTQISIAFDKSAFSDD